MGYHPDVGPMTAPPSPQIIAGRYALLRELTRGGMGAVWVGHDRSLDREIAVKLMLPAAVDQAASRARFEREAKAAAGLASQHVVQIFDFGVDEGSPFLVMELLRGEDLGAQSAAGGADVPVAELQTICAQTAKALTAAHDAGPHPSRPPASGTSSWRASTPKRSSRSSISASRRFTTPRTAARSRRRARSWGRLIT